MSRLSQEELQRDIDLLIETAKAYEARRERMRNKAAGRANKRGPALSALSSALRNAYTPGFFKALETTREFQAQAEALQPSVPVRVFQPSVPVRVARPAARRRRP